MRVGYLQFAPALGQPRRNRERMAAALAGIEADLIVLPELSDSGYNFRSRAELARCAESAAASATLALWRDLAVAAGKTGRPMTIVGGFAERAGRRFYNSAAVVTSAGIMCVYRKAHLFGMEGHWFAPGDEPPSVVEVAGVHLGVIICFDWAFPEFARILALCGADIICHPANIVTSFPPQAMITRGIENRVFTITANRVGTEEGKAGRLRFRGRSQVTSPDGDVLAASGEEEEECRVVEIDPLRARDKRLAGFTDLFAARRPELYGRICAAATGRRRGRRTPR